MKIQKMTDNKIIIREILPDDLGYFLHKGWEVAPETGIGSVIKNDFPTNRKKNHRFEDEA